jgi:hypothetical protein
LRRKDFLPWFQRLSDRMVEHAQAAARGEELIADLIRKDGLSWGLVTLGRMIDRANLLRSDTPLQLVLTTAIPVSVMRLAT